MKQMEPFTRGGIGHTYSKFSDLSLLDYQSRNDRMREIVTAIHLDRLEIVKNVNDDFDGVEAKEKIIYFMENGEVKILVGLMACLNITFNKTTQL